MIFLPLCNHAWFKFKHLLGNNYLSSTKIRQHPFLNNQFSFAICIENFPSFVNAKTFYETERIRLNNTEWFISVKLRKYCRTSNKYIHVTPSSSDEPETLGAFVHGKRIDAKQCSFHVYATFNSNREPPTDKEKRFPEPVKYSFNSSNAYQQPGRGFSALATIDVKL